MCHFGDLKFTKIEDAIEWLLVVLPQMASYCPDGKIYLDEECALTFGREGPQHDEQGYFEEIKERGFPAKCFI